MMKEYILSVLVFLHADGLLNKLLFMAQSLIDNCNNI